MALEEARQARELASALFSSTADSGNFAAGDLFAVSVLAGAYRRLITAYLSRVDRVLLKRLWGNLEKDLGADLLRRLILEFEGEFLGTGSTQSRDRARRAADGSGGTLEHQDSLTELVVFWLLESNPAARPIVQFLHQSPFRDRPDFQRLSEVLAERLSQEPGFEAGGESLLETLSQPARQSPDSLSGQLLWIRSAWRMWTDDLNTRVEFGLDLLAEEQRPVFPPGPGPAEIPIFEDDGEPAYSLDRGWMAGLVLIAKHTLVWLDQLSREYKRQIGRLDEVPDEELERLSSLGFNGLWLIGVWQRSPASQTIKRTCGNPQAVASAYSLVGYQVADELGGEQAWSNLSERAAARGIRLAADMVPNHTGLDSDLVMERPDWFIGQPDSPFPSYQFDGPDLSPRAEIGIFLENHYYDRTDAAVVFKRIDKRTGQTRFIYHGNDGTSTPWNDTAQLDYLDPEVRDFVVETILEVARRVPIIRFDAAMTLTRKHFHRLWFPAPGSAGAIPSRAEHSMSREQFEKAMPVEFWRQVVDRVAERAPDTLLLAEAFWLLEGYFVRSLGMHRVYNSAFMNMLRDGETAGYRRLIKETLEFDPEILKRYVNFMNNPDERTAVDQFGRGDRYFGVCALMSTLPGLPMFGHGQVEGLSERYGMEYDRAYSGEQPDGEMISRHREQIMPLLQQRELFAGVENFELYDVQGFDGSVLEDVIAFSNSRGQDSFLVLFNNSGQDAYGRLHLSVPKLSPASGHLQTSTLASQLAGTSKAAFLRFRDRASRQEFLVENEPLIDRGLEIDLRGFELRILTDFEEMSIETSEGLALVSRIGARGTEDLERVRRDLAFEPVKSALRSALEPGLIMALFELSRDGEGLEGDDQLLDRMRGVTRRLLGAVGDWAGAIPDQDLEETVGYRRFLALLTLRELAGRLAASKKSDRRSAGKGLAEALDRHPETLPALFGWVLLSSIADALDETPDRKTDWIDRHPEVEVMNCLVEVGGNPKSVGRLTSDLELSLRRDWGKRRREPPDPTSFLPELLEDSEVLEALGLHEIKNHTYLSEDGLRTLIDWRLLLEVVGCSSGPSDSGALLDEVEGWWRSVDSMFGEAEAASFRLDVLRGAAGSAELAEDPDDMYGDQSSDPSSKAENRTTTKE